MKTVTYKGHQLQNVGISWYLMNAGELVKGWPLDTYLLATSLKGAKVALNSLLVASRFGTFKGIV